MRTDTTNPLPDFGKPPVVEVVMGVTFNKLRLLLPHYGVYWSSLQPDFPKVLEAVPIDRVVERFPEDPSPEVIDFEFSTRPPMPRQLFTSRDDSHLIQIQEDRFILNWRKAKTDDEYPRYSNVYSMFDTRLTDFRKFLNKIGVEHKTIGYELTYLNHLSGFGLRNLEEAMPGLRATVPNGTILSETESVDYKMTFRLPERKGRLHVFVKTGATVKGDLVHLELTARGSADETTDMKEWFETAREWIVRGFCELTSAEVQREMWERRV